MSHDQVVWQELNLNSSTIQDVSEHLSNLNLRGQIEFENDQSPLVAAVEANRKDLLTLMIEEFGLNVNSTVKNGGDRWCALAAAIVKQDKEMVQFLVNDMEADVNILKYSSTDNGLKLQTYLDPNSTCSLLHWTIDYEIR
jgi:hypothetical protein